MTTELDVAKALASAVSRTGLHCSHVQLESPVVPGAEVLGQEYDPRLVFGQAKAGHQFQVRVLLGRSASVAQMELLAQYRDVEGSMSVIAAIQDGDNWPDDLVDYAVVTRVGAATVLEYPEVSFLSVEFDVEVVW